MRVGRVDADWKCEPPHLVRGVPVGAKSQEGNDGADVAVGNSSVERRVQVLFRSTGAREDKGLTAGGELSHVVFSGAEQTPSHLVLNLWVRAGSDESVDAQAPSVRRREVEWRPLMLLTTVRE